MSCPLPCQLPCPPLRLTLILLVSLFWLAPASAAAETDTAEVALAEQFHLIALLELESAPLEDHHLDRAAALLEMAARLDPSVPRHPRALADVMMLRGDREGALDALNRYGRLRRDDEMARIQYVDLVVAGMQTAEDKVNFLRGSIVDNETLGDALRSHGAVQLHDLHLERGEQAKATAALEQALELNDINPSARQRAYEKLLRDGTAVERVEGLAELLRSNVAQPAVMTALGAELARLGMLDEALRWYQLGTDLALDMQVRAVPTDYEAFGSLLLIDSQPQEARQIGFILQQDPVYGLSAEQIILLAEKQLGLLAPDIGEQVATRFDQLITELAGNAEFDMGGGEPADVIAALVLQFRNDDPFKADVLMANLEAAIRTDLMIADRPTNPKFLAAMAELLGENNEAVVAYTGLHALREGRFDAARVKLEAVKDQQSFAAMGLVLLDAEAEVPAEQLREAANTVLNNRPFGATGALVFDQLRPFNVRVRTPENLPEIRDALAVFPDRLLDLLDPALQREFYDVRIKPLRVAHEYGAPMYVRVTIANTGDLPLTLGPNGVLRNELQFDASVGNQGAIEGASIGQIGGQVRLDRNEEVTRDYRIDLGQLNFALANDPSRPIAIFLSTITNPIVLQGQRVGPGPAGFRTQMRRPLAREAKALGNEEVRLQLFRRLVNGTGGEKVRSIQTLSRYVQLFAANNEAVAQGEGGEEVPIAGIVQRIDRAFTVEVDPAVRAWAGLSLVQIETGEQRIEQVQALLGDDSSEVRMAGLLAVIRLEDAERVALAQELADDPDPAVALYAAGLAALPVADETADDPATSE